MKENSKNSFTEKINAIFNEGKENPQQEQVKKELTIRIIEENGRVSCTVERQEQDKVKERLSYSFEAKEAAIAELLIALIGAGKKTKESHEHTQQ